MTKPKDNAPIKKLKSTRPGGISPKDLLGIRFDDLEAWLKAYRSYNVQMVARAMINAFRRRYFLSQAAAAKKLGITVSTLHKWENGLSSIRWKSRHELVSSGWFKPQHFGLDVDGAEFEAEHGE